MKIISTLLALISITQTSLGSLRVEEKNIPQIKLPDLNKLKLNQEVFLTDLNGVVNPKTVMLLQVGDNIKLYRTDGTLYTGIVTETKEGDDTLQIFGKFNNVPDVSFGFVLARGGIFAGAIVDTKNDKTYTLELSTPHKGYVFLYSFKYEKKIS